jgi:C_GCAxxG_C_C family probable redox protein
MSKADIAVETFKKGFNCSQAVLLAFSDDLGLDQDTAARIASGFGGGICHMAETCGAVSGAIMALSLKKGMSIPGQPFKSNQLVYTAAEPFIKEFVKRNKSTRCLDILGFDIRDNEALLKARKDGHFYRVCTKYVGDAADIVESMLK